VICNCCPTEAAGITTLVLCWVAVVGKDSNPKVMVLGPEAFPVATLIVKATAFFPPVDALYPLVAAGAARPTSKKGPQQPVAGGKTFAVVIVPLQRAP
jgi:hypothetical protein